ncbi:MAG: hypothetical protein AAB440_01585 [Patescibacteria group bacterium]
MSNNALLFIGILIFVFILWVMTGGPAKPFASAGPYVKPIDGPGELAEPYELKRGSGLTSGITGNNSGFFDLGAQLEDLSSYGETSEYRGVVSITRNPSGPRGTTASEEYLSISVSRRAEVPITMTGWKLESMSSGVGGIIPGGVAIPRAGSVNTVSSIVVAPGDTVVVTTGRSPIGVSFRESICTGYLDEFQDFEPDLEDSCPTAREEVLMRYDRSDKEDCALASWSIPRCTVPENIQTDVSSSCESFLEGLNYNSCVAAYQNDPEFSERTWRVFLGGARELWKENHETIRLTDSAGKTVDVFAY